MARTVRWIGLLPLGWLATVALIDAAILGSAAAGLWGHPDWEFLPWVDAMLAFIDGSCALVVVACAVGAARFDDDVGSVLLVVGAFVGVVSATITHGGQASALTGVLAAGAIAAGCALGSIVLRRRGGVP